MKKKYWFIPCGENPQTKTEWYNLVEAENEEKAEEIVTSNGLDSMQLEEIPACFNCIMAAIGYMLVTLGYPEYSLKPLATMPEETAKIEDEIRKYILC